MRILQKLASCLASSARIEASIRQLEGRVANVEDRMTRVEEREKLAECCIDRAQEVALSAKAAVETVKDDITKVLLEEMREREEKKLNFIMHNIGEAEPGTPEEEKRWDEDSFDNVMKALKGDHRYSNSATFSRRIGSRLQDRPRPLLIGLRNETVKTEILNQARNLMKSNLKEVNVVPDLTKKQREADEDMMREAGRKKGEELTQEDRAKNLRWVAVGKKGIRKLVKKEAREHSHLPREASRKRTREHDQVEASKKQRNQVEGTAEETEEDMEEYQSVRTGESEEETL